jgi:hypothetical protein
MNALPYGLINQNEYQQLLALKTVLPDLLDDNIKPALLHGDLWSGNIISEKNHQNRTRVDFGIMFLKNVVLHEIYSKKITVTEYFWHVSVVNSFITLYNSFTL